MKTNLQAGSGWTWISQAIDLNKRFPTVLPAMGLIIAVIGIVPIIGWLVILILGPALNAGTMYAAHTAAKGGKPEIGNLFQGFQDGDRIGSLVALCLPVVIAALVIAVLFLIFGIGAAVGGGVTAAEAADPMVLLAAMGMSLLILAPVAIALMVAAWAMTYFAIPRVLLDGEGGFDAMKQSFAAAKANAGAFLLALLLIIVGAIVLNVLFGMLHLGWIGSLLVGTAMYALAGPTFYFGYREIFGDKSEPMARVPPTAQTPPPPPPASNPPSPPPPTT